MMAVFGSLNMDLMMSMDHFPVPGETKTISKILYNPGGKGANQAVAAARAGLSVNFWGSVGKDPFGEQLLEALSQEQSFQISGIKKTSLPTGTACVWVNGNGDNCILVSPGANGSSRAHDVPDECLTSQTVLLLQMEVSASENWNLIKRAAMKGTRVLLNLAPVGIVPPEILPLLHGIVVNEGEAHQLAEQLGFSGQPLESFGQKLAKNYGPWVSITRGAKEAFLCTHEGFWTASPLAIRPCDTTAAGDTFVGFLGASLAIDLSLPEALHRSLIAGSLACLKKGAIASIPYLSEVLSQMPAVEMPRKVA